MPNYSRRSFVSFVCLALLALAGTAYLAAAAKLDPAFDGTWRSRGYGWVWQVDGGKVARYDIGDGFCIRSSHAGLDRIGRDNQPQLSEDGRRLRLLQEDPDYFYTFDRLSEFPASCSQRPDAGPMAVFDVVAESFATHYAFFEQRDVDWASIVAAARARLSPEIGEAELLAVFEDLLRPFGDSHVGIEAEIDGEEESVSTSVARARGSLDGRPIISGAWNPHAAEELMGDSAIRAGDGLLRYGLLAKDIGYLEVRSMEGMEAPQLEAAMDRVMKVFDGARAVIVDVSRNDGGLDSFARLIARRFAAEPTVAYSKYAGDFEGDRPQAIVLRPPDRPRYVGPVYLITGEATVSAAEIFTMSMRALPNVVHLGETTDGSLSDELWKTLPNGWTLSLSNEVYLDSDGVLWEGRGIPPEIPLAISDESDVTEEEEQSVRDLVAFIEKRSG